MARYRENDFTLFPRKMAKGWVWYFYPYDENENRLNPRSTGIGYSNQKDAYRTKKEAEAYCRQLLEMNSLVPEEEPTLREWYKEMKFWNWEHSRYVKRKLAISDEGKPKITESYCLLSESNTRLHILPAHGHKKISQITPEDCERLLLKWGKKQSHKSANNYKSVYSTMLSEYARQRRMRNPKDDYFNPWRIVEPLGVKSKPAGGVSLEEGKKILDRSKVFPFRNRMLYFDAMKMAFLTGMRIGEVCGLCTHEVVDKTVEEDGKRIRMSYLDVSRQLNDRTGKRSLVKDKEERRIPLSPSHREELEPYMRGPNRYLFSYVPDQSKPITQGAVRDWFYQHLDNVGIENWRDRNIKLHSSRRFFNTLLRRSNVENSIIRKFTGHDSEEMTEHYTDYLPQDMLAIIEAQKRLLGEKPKD